MFLTSRGKYISTGNTFQAWLGQTWLFWWIRINDLFCVFLYKDQRWQYSGLISLAIIHQHELKVNLILVIAFTLNSHFWHFGYFYCSLVPTMLWMAYFFWLKKIHKSDHADGSLQQWSESSSIYNTYSNTDATKRILISFNWLVLRCTRYTQTSLFRNSTRRCSCSAILWVMFEQHISGNNNNMLIAASWQENCYLALSKCKHMYT